MKIYLFLTDKILDFSISKVISGSFRFDENPDEDAKLINIEARDNVWKLISTSDVGVIENGTAVESVKLVANKYYVLKRNNTNYLIYVEETFDNSFNCFSYNENINLTIGNDVKCNINFDCPYLKGICANIKWQNGSLILERKNSVIIYVNGKTLSKPNYIIKCGDKINIFGLKIYFLSNLILINNPLMRVKLNYIQSGINLKMLANDEKPKDVLVKDVELYDKNQYYLKSPRLRRIIKTKEITLSPPPKSNSPEELPLILTIGPMITMGIVSFVMLLNVVLRIMSGKTTFAETWTQIISASAMLISIILWPSLTKKFNKKLKAKKKKELIEKYTIYLNKKRKELEKEQNLQKKILLENLKTASDCLPIIETGTIDFWDKRIEQSDFLVVRIGTGNELLDAKVNYPEEGFSIEEDELREKADLMVQEFKYIYDVPIGYSLYENKITAFMGLEKKCYGLVHNIILQLITYYSYDDLKIVLFTDKNRESQWEYIKYLNHNFSNDKNFRFYSTDIEHAKRIGDYLNFEIQNRIQLLSDEKIMFKPHYMIISDNYDMIRRLGFIKTLTEIDSNLGFSMMIIEDHLSKLPSKCSNFISLGEPKSGILKNSFEEQEQIYFYDEVDSSIDMMKIAKKISNIPVEFAEGNAQLPEAINFLEMEKVGKVEQLNILNRWNTNDSTTSLKAEIGVDEDGNLMYLDLHEKYHGPHGLIAGMTGSGKSEFIITYILSMAINYSPDDVAFILIDYKGGGLAYAFENKATGISLPHLSGTITNLDKSEMDRTLVSIDSEIKRRQSIFNEARDLLGESTIDIYKYQRYYKEGKLEEPVPHLFIICDEFAELKSQQPDFMDNLISVARIGRSLGVHLILATQKPSGVVNDQIWSNTKFRVCLKVQDASDSNEMLKRPDAASLKQTGRFYLQVGYDEYFALGQSGWCGAKYYPSEKIIKQVDKSVNFIGDTGEFIKSIQAGNNIKIEAQGEQLAAIMKHLIDVSIVTGKKAKRLWLNNIEQTILVENLIKKYNIKPIEYNVKAIIGEYDAPEKQEQGILEVEFRKSGNIVIYGNDEIEREGVLNSIIYSSCINHSASELNIYIIDYGSESFRMFNQMPQIGGMVFIGDDEKFKNLFRMIGDEIKNRKKLLIPYGGSFENYNDNNETKLSNILFMINNYEAVKESYPYISEDIESIGRDCERYGINILLTCNTTSTLGRKLSQCFETKYALHLTDTSDYYGVFNKKGVIPRDLLGRGVTENDGIHEFQTASIVADENNLIKHVKEVSEKINSISFSRAPSIPALPEQITIDFVEKEINAINRVPIGISRDALKTVKFDFTSYVSTIISSNKIKNIKSFILSLMDVMIRIPKTAIFFVDSYQLLAEIQNIKGIQYFENNIDQVIDRMIEFEKNSNQNKEYRIMYVFYGVDSLKSKVGSESKLDELFSLIKQSENSNIIFCEENKKLRGLDYENWYSKYKTSSDGIWVGKGFGDQQIFRTLKITKEMNEDYTNEYGFSVIDSSAELIKLLCFKKENIQEDEDE